jgi:hypothetical protein
MIGIAGTAISITGTNFDPTPSKDTVKVNLSSVPPTSATNTSLTTAAPSGASSGHVSVTTASGQAVTSNYFYIPPGSYSVANVGFTGSVTNGGSSTGAVNTAGQIGLVAFDGTVGQQVSAQLNSNFSQGYWPVTLSILSPFGATVASNSDETDGNPFVDSTRLPTTGTYTALVVPTGSNTGSGTVTIYLFSDITGTLSPGQPANFATNTPGQNVRLVFSGTAGRQVSAVLSSTYNQGYWPVTLNILTPYGATLASNSPEVGGNTFVDSTAVSASGTYTVLIDPTGSNTGSGTVTVYLFNDVTGAISPGSPVNIATGIPGQNVRLTFNGTAGQQASAQLSSNYNQGYWPVTLAILNPDGSTLGSNSPEIGGNASLGPLTLGTTGTYTVLIDPTGTNTGSGTASLTLQ